MSIEPSETRERCVHGSAAILLARDVSDMRKDALALSGERIDLLPLARGNGDHTRAGPGKAQRHRAAEPAPGADRDLL